VFVERTEARNTAVLVAGRTVCIEEIEASVGRIEASAGRIEASVGRIEASVGRIEETDIRDIEGIHVVFREQERCM
jgi:hypothetical protein